MCNAESKSNKSLSLFSSTINSLNRQQFYCAEPSIEMRRDNLLNVKTMSVCLCVVPADVKDTHKLI